MIELDGAHHLEKDEKQHDDERTFTFSLDGIKVLRFLNDEVQHDLPSVLKKIEEALSG